LLFVWEQAAGMQPVFYLKKIGSCFEIYVQTSNLEYKPMALAAQNGRGMGLLFLYRSENSFRQSRSKKIFKRQALNGQRGSRRELRCYFNPAPIFSRKRHGICVALAINS
jgi:hypothetical protein